jgi:hypothetical protein
MVLRSTPAQHKSCRSYLIAFFSGEMDPSIMELSIADIHARIGYWIMSLG